MSIHTIMGTNTSNISTIPLSSLDKMTGPIPITTWRGHNKHSSAIVMTNDNADGTNPHLKAFIADIVLQNVVNHHSWELNNQSTYINGRKRINNNLVSEDMHIPSIGSRYT